MPDKPKVGDIIKIKDPEESLGEEAHINVNVRVLAVFDSLDENWDPWGESAWSQGDHDEITGKTAEWYIIVEMVDDPYGTMSLASYEVIEVK